MEVLPDASGRPWLSVSGWLSKIAKAKRIKQFSVSISHSAGYAVATAILVGDPQPL
jgi:phosphopantetheinyl transferase (holo-ACP synthase)